MAVSATSSANAAPGAPMTPASTKYPAPASTPAKVKAPAVAKPAAACASKRLSAWSACATRASDCAMCAHCAASRPAISKSVWPATASTACARKRSSAKARCTAGRVLRRASHRVKPMPASNNHTSTAKPSHHCNAPSTTPASKAAPAAATTGTIKRKYKLSSASTSAVKRCSRRAGRSCSKRAAPGCAQPINSFSRSAASTAKVVSCVTTRSP